MSLNHLVNIYGKLDINLQSVKTDQLLIKMENGNYINFVLPDLGEENQVLLTTSDGKIRWADNNSNVSSVYCCKEDAKTIFNTELNLTEYLIPLRSGNFYVSNNSKVLLKTSLIYKWDNDELPLDFEVKIFINNIEVNTTTEGLNSFPDVFNKFSNEIILDTNEGDIISIRLTKEALDSNNFIIKKNSFYSIELL